ncbi:hypothetical protein BKA66DRAFT_531533 [Pyrenochaeta sp. MPI-SDFR-AT-0127]|nr:hypothetical protein BKA66DRAFT_531533 [Pyrenochaeta sp. MPI-SDFR-AT-0127]
MAQYTPGSIIHYRVSGSGMPLWPAVVCTDDVARGEFLRTRPPGYVTLVLRIATSCELRWAYTTEMYEYDPFVPSEDNDTVASIPGLREAYNIADSALELGLDMSYWRDQVSDTATMVSPDWECAQDHSDDGLKDLELQWAIRESRIAVNKTALTRQDTLGLSPSSQYKGTGTPKFGHTTQKDDIEARRQRGASIPSVDSPASARLSQPSQLREVRNAPLPPSRLMEEKCPLASKTPRSSRFSVDSASDSLLHWDRLRKRSVLPTSDIIEGDLAASKEFVLIHVGPEKEERMIHINYVWSRPYFNDGRTGIMHFTRNDEGMWILSHPALNDIAPEDFLYIVEYLESDDFGLKNPEGVEEVQEAFAQIISAWVTALRLGMTDLLDHILDKLERLPSDMWHIMAFACYAYESQKPCLPAQERLKDVLATDIAQNYWSYLEDDHLSKYFIERLQDLPELERDIYARRIVALDASLDSEEDVEDAADD